MSLPLPPLLLLLLPVTLLPPSIHELFTTCVNYDATRLAPKTQPPTKLLTATITASLTSPATAGGPPHSVLQRRLEPPPGARCAFTVVHSSTTDCPAVVTNTLSLG